MIDLVELDHLHKDLSVVDVRAWMRFTCRCYLELHSLKAIVYKGVEVYTFIFKENTPGI